MQVCFPCSPPPHEELADKVTNRGEVIFYFGLNNKIIDKCFRIIT